MTYEEAHELLEKMVAELPDEILKGLNCGIILTDETITDADGLVILGCYHVEPMGLGRYITIHYGSLVACYGHHHRYFEDKIRDVLHHELIHHLEHLAGDKSLEKQDEIDRARMLFKR